MILIGELSLWVALLMAAWSTTVSYAGGALRRDDLTASGVRGLYATFAMVALASMGLWTALLSRDFSLDYVAGHISQNTPGVYVFTAFWSGQAGSTLFCALMLSMCGTIAIARTRRRDRDRDRDRELVPWATGTLSAILLFLVATSCLAANPFVRVDFTPLDGRGMNPRLHNPAMALHQPSLYLGYVATALPFAFAIAALFTRRLDAEWRGVVQRWTVFSWFFLTIGIVLGMWRAYLDPMRGGSWAWDAVANLSLLPWLTITASLHSTIAEAKRRRLPKWNVALVVVSFLLAIFAAFIAQGGVIEGEPSAAQSQVGRWFSVFFFLTTGITVYLVGARWRDLEAKAQPDGAGRNRHRYGGYIVHTGIVMLLAALAGLSFRRQYDATLKTGQSYQATDPYGHVWRFVSQGVSRFDRADHIVAILALDAYRDGKRIGLITSEKRTYHDIQDNALFQSTTEVGIHSTATLDTYVAPTDLKRAQGSDVADLRIVFNPLVMWVWVGGLVMAFGGLIVLWPQAEQRSMQANYVAV